MKQPYHYIFSFVITWFALFGTVREANCHLLYKTSGKLVDFQFRSLNDTTITSETTVKDTSQGFIQHVELYVDYLKLASIPLPTEDKAELGAGIYTGYNIGLSLEGGYGAKYPEEAYKNAEYVSKGFYGRIGINYLYRYAPGVHLYIGAKYGKSYYEDEGTYELGSEFWNNYTYSFQRTDLQADWFEVIIGSEKQWKGILYLGFVTRLRALRNHDTFTPIKVYSIPGYGRTMDKTIPAVNLYIKFIVGNRRAQNSSSLE